MLDFLQNLVYCILFWCQLFFFFFVIFNLLQYVGFFANGISEILEKSNDNAIRKRRKICADDLDSESINNGESNTAFNNSGDNRSNCFSNKVYFYLGHQLVS